MFFALLLMLGGFRISDAAADSGFLSRRDQFTLSAGPTYYAYSETYSALGTGADFKQPGATAKLAYRHQFTPSRWNLDFNVSYTMLPTTTASGISAQALGGGAKLGYWVPLGSSVAFGLSGGWYYSAMLVSDNSFGYKDVSGPQIVPTLRASLRGGGALTVYFKYSSVSAGGTSFENSSNHELALGGSWTRPLKGNTSFSVILDLANIRLSIPYSIPGGTDTASVNATSYTLSTGFGW